MTTQTTSQVQRPVDVNDFLMGGDDGPSAPFLKIGPAYFDRPAHTQPNEFKGGRIVALRPVQAYKLGPKDPQTGKATRIQQFYQSGKKAGQPIWDALVILQTNERDPEIEGDDGTRQVQLDGFDRYWEATADADCRKRAARLAVTAAGARGLEVGGELYLAWVKQVPTGSMPATHWVARYVPPGQSFQFEQPQQAPTQQAPQGGQFATYPPQAGQPTGPNGWGQPQYPAAQPAPSVGQVAQQYAQQVQQGHAQGPAPQYQQPPVQPAPAGQTPQGQALPAEPPF